MRWYRPLGRAGFARAERPRSSDALDETSVARVRIVVGRSFQTWTSVGLRWQLSIRRARSQISISKSFFAPSNVSDLLHRLGASRGAEFKTYGLEPGHNLILECWSARSRSFLLAMCLNLRFSIWLWV